MDFRPPKLSLRQLQYALAVEQTRSFRRAAELCRVAQPSLSAQIAELESALDFRIFERDRRRVLVTPAGQELIERARRVLVDVGELMDAALRARDPLNGILRLGVIPTIAPYFLPELTKPLRKHFPKATLLWTEDKTPNLALALAAGELDGALVALEAELGDVEHEVIGKDPFVLAAPPEHALAKGKARLKQAELEDEKVLLLEEGHCLRNQVLSLCERARAEELEFRATSLGTLTQMVLSGAGVTLLPTLALAAENRGHPLILRRFQSPEPGRTLALIWRRGAALAPALKALAEVMRLEYAKHLAKASR